MCVQCVRVRLCVCMWYVWYMYVWYMCVYVCGYVWCVCVLCDVCGVCVCMWCVCGVCILCGGGVYVCGVLLSFPPLVPTPSTSPLPFLR